MSPGIGERENEFAACGVEVEKHPVVFDVAVVKSFKVAGKRMVLINSAFISLSAVALLSAFSPARAETFPFVIGYDAPSEIVSMRSVLDAPAGKDGRVFVRDGHFATAKGPIRFNAINLTGSANLPSKPYADRMADRLAGFGINCVRLHFLDSPKGYGTFMLPNEACLLEATKIKGTILPLLPIA